MSLVNVTGVEVGNNPAPVLGPFRFEVVFECLEKLEADLEWKLTYVGSSEDKTLDQELDCVVMGPIHRGALKFAFEADAPDFSKIPPEDILGFTIILLTGSYREEEFVRIGWYIHNLYVDQELQDDPPEEPRLDRMQRIVLTDAPRVTRFKISWDGPKFSSSAPSSSSATIDNQATESVDGSTNPNMAMAAAMAADAAAPINEVDDQMLTATRSDLIDNGQQQQHFGGGIPPNFGVGGIGHHQQQHVSSLPTGASGIGHQNCAPANFGQYGQHLHHHGGGGAGGLALGGGMMVGAGLKEAALGGGGGDGGGGGGGGGDVEDIDMN